MIEIDDFNVVVFTSEQLSTVLSQNNTYTTVYFGANITLQSGITVYTGKPSIAIDGVNPLDPDAGIHTFTDMNSTAESNTIHITSTTIPYTITFQNINIIGNNYYGVPCVYDGVYNVTLIYNNISYTGPQLTYHPNGLTRYIDCDITIEYAVTDRRQEVGEVCQVEMSGNVNIDHRDTDDAVFWFKGDSNAAYFRVLPGANVVINSNSYFMFAAIYVLIWIARPVVFDIQAGSSFILNTNHGFSYNATHQATSFTVGSNATFHYTQTVVTEGNLPSIYLNNAFTVNSGANVYLQGDYTGGGSLIHFTQNTGSLNINNPKSFVLYKRGVAALTFAAAIPYSFDGGQINFWTTATTFPTAGTFEDIPYRKWHKNLYVPFHINGQVSSTSTTVVNHNFENEELTYPLTDLQLQTARVISIGDVLLNVDRIVDNGRPITGTADPNANIRINYLGQTINDTASDQGAFTITTADEIPADTIVTASANIPFLIIDKEYTVLVAGELSIIDAPTTIVFIFTPVSTTPLIYARNNPNFIVEVSDSRVYSSSWNLQATIDGPLTTPTLGYTLPDAVVYVFGDGDAGFTPLSTTTPVTVYNGTANEGVTKITECTWDANRGILMHITQPVYNGEQYTAQLIWEVQANET